jgi:hypothetical protein
MSQTNPPIENVVRGALLALLVLPVGVAVWVALQSAGPGIVVGIVAFAISFGAYWLYQRGAGGVISRTGAWTVTIIVVATLVLCILFGMMADYARGIAANIGLNPWDIFFNPHFLPNFVANFGALFAANALFYLIAIAIAAAGSYRTLRRAFRVTRVATPVAAYPAAPTPGAAPVIYQNDVDTAPTGSADDKTAPPTIGS